MTGRISKRSVLEIRGLSRTVLQNHPLPELLDDLIEQPTNQAGNQKSINAEYQGSCLFPDNVLVSDCSWTGDTQRTLSSCSWGDDEIEQQETQKVQLMLDDVNSMLFSEKDHVKLQDELHEECLHWKKHFPHFRILGEQLMPSVDEVQFIPPKKSSENLVQDEPYIDSVDIPAELKIQGQHLNVIEPPSEEQSEQDCSSLDFHVKEGRDFVEEVLIQEGEYQELLVCDPGNGNSDMTLDVKNTGMPPSKFSRAELDGLVERIVGQLANKIWPDVLSWVEGLGTNNDEGSKGNDAYPPKYLPPVMSPVDKQQRPLTAQTGRGVPVDLLDGVLTVSSKILQTRADHKFSPDSGVSTRPGSSMITFHKGSSSRTSRPTSSRTIFGPPASLSHLARVPSAGPQKSGIRGRELSRLHMQTTLPESVQEEQSTLPDIGVIQLNFPTSALQHQDSTDQNCTHSLLPPLTTSDQNQLHHGIKSPGVCSRVSSAAADRMQYFSYSRPSTSKSNKGNIPQGMSHQRSPPLQPLVVTDGVNRNKDNISPPDLWKDRKSPENIITLTPLVTPLILSKQQEKEPNKRRTSPGTRKSSQHRIFPGRLKKL
ncbi:protein FAM149B1-like [Limulus polyphemus]|uniref:Protein FAM149B1-like n=1 Tax=Limulus polyphemus TaxID=6850 RepID=A0ABM1SGB9_LIMPO|nr:protein FAM149B1-like [Limulus polyphemus]XP_022242673.1 protein FAM149B1-like [Limulus polyphemus]XP_022242674.1 protein FAM149B1-like [Limulus polyphemus]